MRELKVIGADLGGTKLTVGAVSNGMVTSLHRRRIQSQESEQVVLEEVVAAISTVFDDSVVGIGFGVPAVVDNATGLVLEVENIPSWRQVPLKTELEHRFGVPAYVNNDANAFAVGEHLFGKGRGFRNMVGLTLGTGLGAGVIVDGKLHCGRTCGAGEIGMMPDRGHTVETFCSGRFFPRECGDAGERMYERARAGDVEALACYRRFGREVARAITIVVYAYDPEAVILGGSISSAFDLFEHGMREHLASSSSTFLTDGLVIERSELENSAVLGAAALWMDATSRVHPLEYNRVEG